MQKNNAIAIFAAGCFWGVQAIFDQVPGVVKTTVGYTGGKKECPNPSYELVCTGTTGHAEAVQITFDQQKITYAKLLDILWMNHDPTTLNRQGPDVGAQYRSAIFYTNEQQKQTALKSKPTARKIQLLKDLAAKKRATVSELLRSNKMPNTGGSYKAQRKFFNELTTLNILTKENIGRRTYYSFHPESSLKHWLQH